VIRALLLGTAALAFSPSPALAVPSLPAACDTLLRWPDNPGPPRAPRAEDLIELRDLGYPAALASTLELSLSPDRSQVVFPIQRANLTDDSYCAGLVILDPRTGAARLLDPHPGLAMRPFNYRGPTIPGNVPAFVTARWSPDGRWIAYLRAADGVTRLWRVSADGSEREAVPGTDETVEDFAWSEDGKRMVVTGRFYLATASAAIRQEDSTGHRYDERFLPFVSSRPFPVSAAAEVRTIELATGSVHPATDEEKDWLGKASKAEATAGPVASKAWLAPKHLDRYGSPKVLGVSSGAHRWACPEPLCDHATAFWWSEDGKDIAYLRREGWAASQTGLYVWHKGARQPERILLTDDFLVGCLRVGPALLCGHEAPTQPRRIVTIDLRTGAMQSLFDPNPEFRSINLQPARRLHWSTQDGSEAFGELVLPAGIAPNARLPLIVTTYQTRGFLRGATGDEYPIQLFADHGFAVLSTERTQDVGTDTAGIRTVEDLLRHGTANWIDRRNVQSSLDRGVEALVDQGLVDPGRVGVTGLSDGATSVMFALLNSKTFSAAAVSNCCIDPWTFAVAGPVTAATFRKVGYPSITDDAPEFWKPMSLARNARTFRTPLLMQLPDEEFLLAQQSLAAFHETGAPVEAYVFPGERHVKIGPLHRKAIYERNIAWFDFWLRDQRATSLVSETDFARWKAMRDKLHQADDKEPASERAGDDAAPRPDQ
jgi:dipeptidyl aminopeptidase/acylaminoacyl peptidase